jgi:hypothetical protein
MRAGSEVRPASGTDSTVTPGAMAGIRDAPGAAAHANAAKVTSTIERRSTEAGL